MTLEFNRGGGVNTGAPSSTWRLPRAQVGPRLSPSTLLLPVLAVASVLAAQQAFHSTIFWWSANGLILIYLAQVAMKAGLFTKDLRLLGLYITFNVICCLRGAVLADDYWEWKALIDHAMALSLPLVGYACLNSKTIATMLRAYLTYALPLFPLIALLIPTDLYGFYLTGFVILLIGIKFLPKRWRLISFSVALFVVLIDFGARSNVIRVVIPLALLVFELFPRRTRLRLLRVLALVLFLSPMVFLILGVSGKFNIFKLGELLRGPVVASASVDTSKSIDADTRTFLYMEVYQTAERFDSWLLGRSPSKGTETTVFADIAEVTGKAERATNEAGILNVFIWEGVVGVIFYAWVFGVASWRALYRSNSSFCVYLGVFVSFRWAYAWVEDPTNFSLNYAIIWILIGMCLSRSFRCMDDAQIRAWFLKALPRYRTRAGWRAV